MIRKTFGGMALSQHMKSAAMTVVILVSVLAITSVGAPLNGKTSSYRQPDGSVINVKFFGDEFYARTETEDGYTVVFDPATKAYYYAELSPGGNDFVSTGNLVGKIDPATVGLKKGVKLGPAARGAKAQARFEAYDAVVKQRERWENVKAASREYRQFKKALKKQLKEGKKGFAIPLGTVMPDSGSASSPQMAPGDKDVETAGGPELGPPSFTLTGDVVGLTILVDFSDDPGTVITQAEVDDYCNKPNYTGFGNSGSIYDYFFIQSGGTLRYNNNVTYYVRVPEPKTYYNDTSQDSGICGRLLLNDALDVLIADGYDFSQLTTKSGGNVRCCNIFFAGEDSGVWAKGLWPHRWVLSPSKSVGPGMQIYDYQITEIGTSPTLKIGTFCHENGHMMLGYPDLYSYNGNAANLGYFSLMASGNYGGSGYHPTHIDPYLKTASGWTDIIELDSSSHQRCTVQVDGNQFYRYLNPSESREYFMFEVRDNTGYEGPYGGHGSSVNPAAGLLAWHLREHGTSTQSSIFTADNPNCDYTTPYETLIIEANPSAAETPWYDNPTPGSDDGFKSSGVSQISDSTTPALKFWDASGRGTASGADIHSISADGPIMTFVIGTGAPSGTPEIILSRSTLDVSCDLGDTVPSETFSIANGQGGTLSYTITDNQSWLSCSPASGTATTESDTITITFSTSGLTAGSYSATITVTDPGASPTTDTITVNLTVNPQPVLSISTNMISETAFSGSAGPQIGVALNNTGGGELTYTLSKTNSWVMLSSTSGTLVLETDTIYVDLDASSLGTGTYYDAITITSPEASNSPQTIPITFTVSDGPVASVTPTNLFMYATTGGVDSASVLLGNTGGSPLTFIITDDLPSATDYSWEDSDAAGGPTYSWIDISGIGTSAALGDDAESALLSVGFDFPFYGNTYNQYQIGANGVVSFAAGQVGTGNAALPSASIPSQALAGFWDDLNPGAGGDIMYHSNASRLVVSWLAVPRYGTTENQTFQIVIYPDGRIVYQYQSVNGTLTSCTVGIQDSNSTGPSVQVVNNAAYLKNSLAVEFTPPEPPWLTYPVSSGSVPQGSSSSVWFYASASNLTEGVYTAIVSIAMNDINYTQADIPVIFDVSSVPVPRVTVSPTSLSATEGGANDTYTLVLGTLPSNDVVVTVSPDAELSVDKTNVTFTTGNWDQAQTVTVTAFDDGDHELAHSGTITHSASSTDGGYDGLTIDSVTVNITDNDNNAPSVEAGPDQTVYLTGGTWKPTDVGVSLWLDADDAATVQLNGGTVSNWVDKSGNGRDATQGTASSQPTDTAAGLNGKHVVRFDGSTDYLNLDLDFMAGVSHSAFIVVANMSTYSDIYGAANGSAGSQSLHVGFSSASSYRMNYWGHDYGPAVTANFDSSGSLLNYIWDVGSPKQILANGNLEGSGHNALAPDVMSGGGRIGRVVNHPYLGADIAEVIMKTGTVSQAERELFEGYLAHKWGIETNLPGGHPYETQSPSGAEATANLAGSATDADLDPLTIQWSVLSGPEVVSFDDDTATNAVATFTKEGTYVLQLAADDTVTQVVDTVTITVSAGGAGVVVSESDSSTDVTEGGTADDYTVVLAGPPEASVTVNLSTNGQVSVSPSSLNFTTSNWDSAQTVTVTAIDDAVDEGSHTGTISHSVSSADTNYNGIAVNKVIPNITDNDAPGTIGIENATYNVSEAGVTVTINVTRTGGDAGAVSVDILTSDGTAVAGVDYTANSQSLNWTDRTSDTKSFIVNIADNGVYTGDRNFMVDLTNKVGSAGLGTTSATVTIQEDEPVPDGARVISQIPDAGVSQGAGVTQVTLTFDEAMDTNSFSLVADIRSFTGPQGTNLISTITGYSWGNGDTELTIMFDPLTANGSSRLVVGPDILNPNAFSMDQDNDSNLGEAQEDTYAANIWVATGGTNVTLWSDLLGTDDSEDPGWTLGTGWAIGVPTETPPAGPNADTDAGTKVVAQNLNGNYTTTGQDTYSETPDIDASTFTSVALDFQEWKGLGKNDEVYVDVGYGVTWNRVYTYTGPGPSGANDGSWGAHNIDLTANVTGTVFRVRWGLADTTGGGSGVDTGWQLDAIRLSGDSTGGSIPPPPVVVTHSPTGTFEGTVSSLYLEFSQPMDTGTFALGDIASFTGPVAVSATNFSWVSDTLLRIDFAQQSTDGTYTLVLNHTVSDSWAQTLDQDKNGTGGEGAQDQYSASFTINNVNFIPAPSGLSALAISSSQVDLDWTDNSANETGFAVERSTTSGTGFAVVASLAVNSTNGSDLAVAPGVTYYYRVQATNATDTSATSAEAFAAVPKAPATITLGDLNQTYDGSPRPISTSTSPTGLTVNVTYNGSGTPPTSAGSYSVVAVINDATYQGSTNDTLVVSKATPNVSVWPTASGITYGQTLASATLSGGSASVAGSFSYDSPASTPDVGTNPQAVTFTPTDSTNYDTVGGSVSVTVGKATPTVTTWPTAAGITYGQAVSNATLSGGSASVAGSFSYDSPATTPNAGTYPADVTFTPTDTSRYVTVGGSVNVSVAKATPTVTTWPTAAGITYGQALSAATLSGGSASVAGSFAYDSPATTPDAGTYGAAVTFTPTDSANYANVGGSVNVSVAQATPTVTTWPTATPIIEGQAISNATLSGGSASVTGSFSYDAPGTVVPTMGIYTAAVTFAADDSVNYSSVAGTVNITVNQAPPATPTGLNGASVSGHVDLDWAASPTADSYNVKRSAVSGGPYTTIGTPLGTNYSDLAVAQGSNYYYVVSATNSGGESADSSEVNVTVDFLLPFADDFEASTIGNLDGQNGWVASNTTIQTSLALGTNAASIDADDGFMKHNFDGDESNVWTDLRIQPVFATEDLLPSDTNVTTVIFFNTNGHPVVYSGTNLVVFSGTTIATGAWVRVTVHSDYTAKTWDLYIDGVSVATGLGFYNTAPAGYQALTVSGGSDQDGAEVDNVSVGLTSPITVSNQPPSVVLITPTNGSLALPGANLPITAVSSDSDGTVTNVSFYRDTVNLVGTSTVVPTSTVTLVGVPMTTTFTLIAIAVDNDGAAATSAVITVVVDGDDDGLPDQWEEDHGLPTTNNNHDVDSDGDGVTDYDEYVGGTSPNDPVSRLAFLDVAVTNVSDYVFTFESVTDRLYTIEWSVSPSGGVWSNLVPESAGTGGPMYIMDPSGDRPRFYRIRVRQP